MIAQSGARDEDGAAGAAELTTASNEPKFARRHSWFRRLFGFDEIEYQAARSMFRLTADQLAVKSSHGPWSVGSFTTPSLQQLRDSSECLSSQNKALGLSIAVADVSELLSTPENRRATFQVASQMNCLEFPSPDCIPEDGVSGYEGDRTQGPACSIACGPATVFRNYFAPVTDAAGNTATGQSTAAQLNNADDLLAACVPAAAGVFVVNGYMQATSHSLETLNNFLANTDRETLLPTLKVGVHSDVEVRTTYTKLPVMPTC